MNQLRKDPLSDSWVIVASERLKRPQFIKIKVEKDTSEKQFCPFCYGNEALTPPEIFAIRPDHSKPNTSGWLTRVVPNKFPALKVELNPESNSSGIYTAINGCGAHEVIIESPEHNKNFSHFNSNDFFHIFITFRERINDLKRDIRLQQVLIFKNSGALAGATLSHPHSQLIALPIISSRLQQKLNHFQKHQNETGNCLLCTLIDEECKYRQRIVSRTENLIIIAPYASRYAFELQILPLKHFRRFEESSDQTLRELSNLFSKLASSIFSNTEIEDFNLILHTAPLQEERSNFHWHIEFFPQISRLAAFEWGSGFYINPILPEEVAAILAF